MKSETWNGVAGLVAVLTVVVAVGAGAVHWMKPSHQATEAVPPGEALLFSARPLQFDFVSSFVLPWNAPLGQFPFSGMGCNADQYAWLQSHGQRVPPTWSVTVRNTAQEGGAITLDNVRARGVSHSTAQAGILFVCPNQGVGDSPEVTVDLDAGTTKFNEPGRAEQSGSLFALNLFPGEEGHIQIGLTGQTANYAGVVVADLHSGSLHQTIPLPAFGHGRFSMPGVGPHSIQVEFNGGSDHLFTCSSPFDEPTQSTVPCSLSEIRRRLSRFQ